MSLHDKWFFFVSVIVYRRWERKFPSFFIITSLHECHYIDGRSFFLSRFYIYMYIGKWIEKRKFFFQNILRYMLLFNKWDRRLFLEGFFFFNRFAIWFTVIEVFKDCSWTLLLTLRGWHANAIIISEIALLASATSGQRPRAFLR